MVRRRNRQQPVPRERGLPSGLLYNVLLEYWDTVPPGLSTPGPAAHEMMKAAEAGHGFHARAGAGCDAAGTAPGRRCGEKPCAHFAYTPEAGGATLGVRACSDHLAIAREEEHWRREAVSADLFAVWEVMTA